MKPINLTPETVDRLPISGGEVEESIYVTADMRARMNLPHFAKRLTVLKRQAPLPLVAEGWMPPYAFDSKGQAWSLGSHGGVIYKTQSRVLACA
jgi:hypothetical protein